LVDAINVLVDEDGQCDVKNFKSVDAAKKALGKAIADNVAEGAVIPSDVFEVATAAEIEIPKAKATRKRGDHCHTRVFSKMLELDKPMTKAEIAEAAGTTPAVVANALYDIRRGNKLPSKFDGQKFPCPKTRDPERGVLYSLGEPEELPPEQADLFD
jgi:hypothetical protein